jgi:hypothetical protein
MQRAVLEVQLERLAPITEVQTPSGLVLRRALPLSGQPDEETWAAIVAVLRDATGQAGTVRTEGLLRSWEGRGLDARVAPNPSGAGWRLSLNAAADDQSPALGGFFLVTGTGISAGAGWLAGPRWMLLGAILGGLGAVIMFAGIRWRRRWRDEQRERLAAVAASLALRGDVVL